MSGEGKILGELYYFMSGEGEILGELYYFMSGEGKILGYLYYLHRPPSKVTSANLRFLQGFSIKVELERHIGNHFWGDLK